MKKWGRAWSMETKGAIIRQELQNFILGHLQRQGYRQVFTPHIGRLVIQNFRALSITPSLNFLHD